MKNRLINLRNNLTLDNFIIQGADVLGVNGSVADTPTSRKHFGIKPINTCCRDNRKPNIKGYHNI